MTARENTIEIIEKILEQTHKESITVTIPRLAAELAVSMLKEQETTFIKDGHHIMCKSCGAYWCGTDREGDRYPQNFCPNCGRAVK